MKNCYTDAELAKELGVNRSTVFRWRKLGMPNTDLALAASWAQDKKLNSHPGRKVIVQDIAENVAPIAVDGVTAYDVRDRLQAEEQAIAAEIAGLNKALEGARLRNDEQATYKLSMALKLARKEHRSQSDALLKAESRIILLEESRGSLVSLDSAKDLITKLLAPILIFIKKLPDAAESEKEKVKLSSLAEAGLAIIRNTSQELKA